MRIIFLGAPGTGKGTQAALISEKVVIPHLSTGDMFREAIANKTDLGLQVKGYLDAGKLVPDELTINSVKERLHKNDCAKGFILDGFPRTEFQAQALDKFLGEQNTAIDIALLIDVPEEKLIERLSSRRVCPHCGATYNILSNQPEVSGTCDVCNTQLIQRPDDTESTIKNRLAVYHNQTKPLIDYFEKQGKLKQVEGIGSVADVNDKIMEVVRRLASIT